MNLLNRLKLHSNSVKTTIPTALNFGATQKKHVFQFMISQELKRIENLIHWLSKRTTLQWSIFIGFVYSVMLFSLFGVVSVFVSPHNHTFSYYGDNCFFNPLVLPKTIDQSSADYYQADIKPAVSIGDTPIFSTNTCVEITKIPNVQSDDTLTLKTPLSLQKTISLNSDELPRVTPYNDPSEAISLDAVMLYSLDKKDETFSYKIKIEDSTNNCILNKNILGCPLENHSLSQGKTYQYSLHRVLGDSTSEIMTSTLKTLDPIAITSGSVSQNEIIYDAPKSFSFAANKSIKTVRGVSLTKADSQKAYVIGSKIDDSNITISTEEDLPRNSNFALTIESIESVDGSFSSEPYSVSFKTSSGPQVQGVNIGSYGVNPNGSVSIAFDIELDQNQSISEFVSLRAAGVEFPSTISLNNNVVTINPDISLGVCSSFVVEIKDGIKSKYGIFGNSAWSLQSRTTCGQTFSIGSSVQGRSIIGHRFGNGPVKILYVGGMHGDEKSSVFTLNSFIEDLERNYSSIPANKTVVVIPNSNPDGFVASSRVNVNNVDLNRNFPTNDWASGVFMPGNIFLPQGGGLTPLSEPESATLASYTTSLSPRVTLTFHATGRAVFANDAGDSKTLSDLYAQNSGFTSFNSSDSDTFFSYPTTGEYEDWLRDRLNLPGLLVELAGVGGNEFNRQKPALWSMLSL